MALKWCQFTSLIATNEILLQSNNFIIQYCPNAAYLAKPYNFFFQLKVHTKHLRQKLSSKYLIISQSKCNKFS